MSVQENRNGPAPDAHLAKTVELLDIDDHLQEELQRLVAINQEILDQASPGNDNVSDPLQEELQRLVAINQEILGQADPEGANAADPADEAGESARLRRDNAELLACIEVFEQALQGKAADAGPTETPSEEGSWEEQQKEYEALLEEKSEVIRTLHQQIQELHDSAGAASEAGDGAGGPAEPVVDEAELGRLKKQLQDQRARLEEDEEELMTQMRQMEMAMAKDRAELARQRTEIQRLQHALNHEIEHASRDHGLRARLGAVQRLQGEVTGRKQPTAPSVPAKAPSIPAKAPSIPAKQPAEPAPATPQKKPANGKLGSGVWRRVFGK